MKTKLTKEQSLHLISLGVPKEKAHDKISYGFLGYEPIFQFTDLLDILPKEIDYNNRTYFLHIQRLRFGIYSMKYENYSGEYLGSNFIHNKEFIDGLYELIIWCIENKHLTFIN